MATANIKFSTSGSAPNGYRVRYRKIGDTGDYTTVSPNPTTSPATISNYNFVGIEGLIDADCGSGVYSNPSPFKAMSPVLCAGTTSDIYTGTSAYSYDSQKIRLNLFNWTSPNVIRLTFDVFSTYANPAVSGTRPAQWVQYKNGSQSATQSYVGVMSTTGSWGSSLNNPGPKYHTISPAVYTSAAGATSSGTTITVTSTTGLVAGMTVKVTAGVGAFEEDTRVTTVTNATSFVVNKAPTTALSGGASVVKAIDTFEYEITIAEAVPSNPTSCSWSLALDCNYVAPDTNCSTPGTGTTFRALWACPVGSTTLYFTNTVVTQSGQRVQSGGSNYYVYKPEYNVTNIPYTITGASSLVNVVTVCSTANLVVGMNVSKLTGGTGAFQSNTVITQINSATTFTIDKTPTTPLSGATILCQSPDPANFIGTVTVLTGQFGCPSV